MSHDRPNGGRLGARPLTAGTLALLLALGAGPLLGCGRETIQGGYAPGSSSTGGASHTLSSSSGGASGSTGTTHGAGATSSSGSSHGAVTALAVLPNPATLTVSSGAGSLAFHATATYADGTSAPVSPAWSFDRADLGQIDATGTLTAIGNLGGTGHVAASYLALSATVPVQVLVELLQNPAGLSPAQESAFDSPTATASGTLLYPYDATVFPQGLTAPEVMWSGGTAGDSYRLRLTEAACEVTLYLTADPPSDFPLPQDVWDTLTASNQGEPVSLDLERLSGGVAFAAMHEAWTIAQGSLRGSIYYWAVSEGQLMKISPGGTAPTPVFDPGPADQLGTPSPADYDGTQPPWTAPTGSTNRCVACHTVSKDGSTAVAVFERQSVPTSPWGTIDLTASPADVVQMSDYERQAVFLGLTPDGTYAVENDADFSLHLYQAHAGTALPSALDALTGAADPAFSPDGRSLAFASSAVGSYPIEYTQSDLSVMAFDPDAGQFSGETTIVPGGTEAVAFPSFSPDSDWVFYQYGDYSRAKYGTSSVGHDDLYLTDVAGQVGPQLLARASGASLSAQNQHLSYQPTVNPISVGGYTWVVFVSPRDYGNQMLSVSNPTYENRKQLWVAAVDAAPVAGTDPSHPAFWLPGQDLTTINMSGYWALEACQATAGSCTQGFECCSGHCGFQSELGTCVAGPPDGGCSPIGDACSASSDCCGSNEACVGGYCASRFE